MTVANQTTVCLHGASLVTCLPAYAQRQQSIAHWPLPTQCKAPGCRKAQPSLVAQFIYLRFEASAQCTPFPPLASPPTCGSWSRGMQPRHTPTKMESGSARLLIFTIHTCTPEVKPAAQVSAVCVGGERPLLVWQLQMRAAPLSGTHSALQLASRQASSKV